MLYTSSVRIEKCLLPPVLSLSSPKGVRLRLLYRAAPGSIDKKMDVCATNLPYAFLKALEEQRDGEELILNTFQAKDARQISNSSFEKEEEKKQWSYWLLIASMLMAVVAPLVLHGFPVVFLIHLVSGPLDPHPQG